MKKHLKNIVILPGDGIGPEVIAQAEKSINAIAYRFNHDLNLDHALIGAKAMMRRDLPFQKRLWKNAERLMLFC